MSRPVTILLAAILTAIIGIAALAVAVVAVVTIAGSTSSPASTMVLPGFDLVIVGLAVSIGLFGLAALGAAFGLSRRAAWAYPVAGIVHVVALAGALIATATSGPNAAVLTALGVAIAVGGLATLTSPSSRSARWT